MYAYVLIHFDTPAAFYLAEMLGSLYFSDASQNFFTVHSIVVCIVVAFHVHGIQRVLDSNFVHNTVWRKMEDIVDFG